MNAPLPVKERYRSGVWNRFFSANLTTRAALPWTALFLRLRLSPNQVSLLAFLASCTGTAILLAAAFPGHRAVAAALLLLSLVWDHSDGQVARRTGRGSVLGGLIDSIFDRLVESSWIVAIGADALLHPERAWLAWRPWQVLLVTTLALHADLYVRWSTALKSLAPLHQSLKRAYREGGGSELRIPLGARTPSTELGRTFFLPIYFGRDLSLWMLAGVAVLPDAALGLLAFGVAHLARGFELNWYTRNHLRDERRAYWKVLDPDYH